jgi:hypothetical protein
VLTGDAQGNDAASAPGHAVVRIDHLIHGRRFTQRCLDEIVDIG